MKHRNAIKQLLNLGLVSLLATLSSHALASGFQLFEYNGVTAGDAGAGGAAIAEDASTGFINPAGLTRLKSSQVVIAGSSVLASTAFEGSSTWRYKNIFPYQASGRANGGAFALIPAFHYALPLNSNVVFGFGVTVPFGLATHYAKDAFTRYATTSSEINAIDISPSLGFKVNEQLSLGFGVDVMKLTASLDSVGGLPSVPGFGPQVDSTSQNEASDWGYGWHAGMLYQVAPATRVGLSYRSQAVFHPSGTSTLTGHLAGPPPYNKPMVGTSTVTTDVTLPPMTSLSVYHDVNDRLAVMGSAHYTQWTTIKSLVLHNVLSAKTDTNPSGLIDVGLPLNFRNTWRFAVGANYKLNQNWLLRAGVGYDQTPVNDADRSLRLPDANRTLLSLGTHYQATKTIGLDLGYTHVFMNNAPIHSTTESGASSTENTGISKGSVDLIGAQITWNLG